jgi:hypothetical protein
VRNPLVVFHSTGRLNVKKRWIVFLVLVLALSILPVTAVAKKDPVTIELLNPPKKGVLELSVGESYVFDIEITSDDPFVSAMAMGDEYYPGRGIFYNGNDLVNHATYALLHLTVTGKEPTDFLPEGVCPIAVVAGVRFPGVVFSERFDMYVRVVP